MRWKDASIRCLSLWGSTFYLHIKYFRFSFKLIESSPRARLINFLFFFFFSEHLRMKARPGLVWWSVPNMSCCSHSMCWMRKRVSRTTENSSHVLQALCSSPFLVFTVECQTDTRRQKLDSLSITTNRNAFAAALSLSFPSLDCNQSKLTNDKNIAPS